MSKHKQPAAKAKPIDLGALQSDFDLASKALKSASTKLVNAQELFDSSKLRFERASATLAAASRNVLTGN